MLLNEQRLLNSLNAVEFMPSLYLWILQHILKLSLNMYAYTLVYQKELQDDWLSGKDAPE